MKVTVDVDCTPEEARRFMGLPDMAPIHDVYLEKIRSSIEDGITPETVEKLMRAWGPMGDAGVTFWKQLMDTMGAGALTTQK